MIVNVEPTLPSSSYVTCSTIGHDRLPSIFTDRSVVVLFAAMTCAPVFHPFLLLPPKLVPRAIVFFEVPLASSLFIDCLTSFPFLLNVSSNVFLKQFIVCMTSRRECDHKPTAVSSSKRLLRDGHRCTTALTSAQYVRDSTISPDALELLIQEGFRSYPIMVEEIMFDVMAYRIVWKERTALRTRP